MSNSRTSATPRLAIATGYSSIDTRSTYHSSLGFNKDHENLDVFRTSVHQYGLPIAVMIDGKSCGVANSKDVQALASHITSELVNFVDKFNNKNMTDDLIKDECLKMYSDIFNIKKEKSTSIINASVSALAFIRNSSGELKVIGFGSGNILVVAKDAQRVLTLVSPSHARNEASWAELSSSEVTAILSSVKIINQSITAEQEIIFMTDGAYEPVFKLDNGSLPNIAENIATLGKDILQLADVAELTTFAEKEKSSPAAVNIVGGDATVGKIDIATAVAIEKSTNGISSVASEKTARQMYGRQTSLAIGIGIALGVSALAVGMFFLPQLLLLLPVIGTAATALSAALGLTITAEALLATIIVGASAIIGTLGGAFTTAVISRATRAERLQEARDAELVHTPVGLDSAGILMGIWQDRMEHISDLKTRYFDDDYSSAIELVSVSHIDTPDVSSSEEDDNTPKMDMS